LVFGPIIAGASNYFHLTGISGFGWYALWTLVVVIVLGLVGNRIGNRFSRPRHSVRSYSRPRGYSSSRSRRDYH
jgi:hypothetical protein